MHYSQHALRARARRKLALAFLAVAAMVGFSFGYMAENAGAVSSSCGSRTAAGMVRPRWCNLTPSQAYGNVRP
jgi:hypothetical protein